MNEKPFFFQSGRNKLFGVLHKPSGRPNNTGYVFCAPFAEEKLWSQRVFVNFARKLASHGYTVLRFDYGGDGDSDGSFADSTVQTRVDDIIAAISVLQQESKELEKIGLLGLRFGATLATLVADRRSDIDEIVLWEPVLQGSKYMKSLFRVNITTQTATYKQVRYNSEALIEQLLQGNAVSIEGYDLMHPLYEQIIEIDICKNDKIFTGDVIVVQVVKKEGQKNKLIESFCETYNNAIAISVVEKQFWKEIKEYYYIAPNLYDATIDWLRKRNE